MAASSSEEHGLGACSSALQQPSPSASRRREHGHEKARLESQVHLHHAGAVPLPCGEEVEGGLRVEVDGGGNGGGSVDDGVLASEDDLAGCAGVNLHRSKSLSLARASAVISLTKVAHREHLKCGENFS